MKGWLSFAAVASILSYGATRAARSSAAGDDASAGAAALLDALLALASSLGARVLAAPGAVAIATAAVAIALFFLGGSSPRGDGGQSRREPARLGAALAVAACAQLLMLLGRPTSGALLYLTAIGLYLWQRPPALEPAISKLRPRDHVAIVAVAAGFAVICLHRLDVYPLLVFDEEAYLVAARISLEQIEPTSISGLGPHLYRLERFEAQPIPFALQRLAVWLEAPGLMATRLASVVAATGALFVGMLALARRVGAGHAIGAGILWACSPLFLSFGRTGLYVVFTILHAVLCLMVLLRFLERWDSRSGALLGVLLGASLYLYQLSWFVPILAGLVLVASAGIDVRRIRRLWVVALLALIALAPSVLLPREGFEQLLSQSRSLFGNDASTDVAMVRLPERADDVPFDRHRRALAERGVVGGLLTSSRGEAVLTLTGPPKAVSASLHDPIGDGGHVISLGRAGPLWHLRHGFARVFYLRPGLGDDARLNHALLLNPLVTPLLVLGLVEAVRRRRQPVILAALVWLLSAVLLPWTLTGAAPRRLALVFPALQLVAMLPLVTLWDALRVHSTLARNAARAAIVAYLGVTVCTGLHLFFEEWQDPLTLAGKAPAEETLSLVQLLRSLPPTVPVLVATDEARLARHLGAVQGINQPNDVRVKVVPHPTSASVRLESCGQEAPFRWVTARARRDPDPFRGFSSAFEVEIEERGRHRILRVAGARPGACE